MIYNFIQKISNKTTGTPKILFNINTYLKNLGVPDVSYFTRLNLSNRTKLHQTLDESYSVKSSNPYRKHKCLQGPQDDVLVQQLYTQRNVHYTHRYE